MNPLLARQLRKHLHGLDVQDPRLGPLLAVIDEAYEEHNRETRFLAHTLELASDELTAANEQLRRDAEHRLHSLNAHYQQVLEGQLGVLLAVRREGDSFVHTLCRGQLARRLGWTPDRVEGHRAGDFLPEATAAKLEAAYEKAWQGQPCTLECTPGDDSVTVLARLLPHEVDGREREVIVSGVEITERKLFERELMTARDRAEAADRAKSAFLAMMSHEIRTPLNAVLGFAELLLDTELNEQQRHWLSTIDQSGTHLLHLINDVLDLARIEADQLVIEDLECSLPDVLEAVGDLFRARLREKGLRFSTQIADDVPRLVVTDTRRLQQILVNLVSNAVKFTATGSISVRVSLDEKPADDLGRRILRFAVSDTGVGIPASARERLFKAFGQADTSTSRLYGGTGLGLTICQRLCRCMGGDIDFDSRHGEGSTFTFTVRAGQIESTPTPVAAPRPAANAAPRVQRVLVAEDNPANRRLIIEMLRRLGVEPDIVGNGRAAVTAATQHDYELIFMDVLMPELDGISATREIRAALAGQGQPRIVALTASVLAEQQDNCLEAGMDAVISKPIEMGAIERELTRPHPTATV